MGAIDVSRDAFIELVEKNAHQPPLKGPWRFEALDPDSWVKSPVNYSTETSAIIPVRDPREEDD